MVNAIMNGSEGPAKSHPKQTSDKTTDRQYSKQSTNEENLHHKISSTVLTNKHAPDETESLLAQHKGIARVVSSGYVSHLHSHSNKCLHWEFVCSTVSSVHSMGSHYSRCCGVM